MTNRLTAPEQYIADFFLLRTPALPVGGVFKLLEICDDRPAFGTFAHTLLRDEYFMEAMYISSPEFYAQLMRLRAGEIKASADIFKLELSLFKYYNRMSSRCTPFGLLAGCSLGSFGEGNKILLTGTMKPQLRLDMDFLGELSGRLALSDSIIRKGTVSQIISQFYSGTYEK